MATVQILLDDLTCNELETMPVITEKSENIHGDLDLHKNTERILMVQHSSTHVSCL